LDYSSSSNSFHEDEKQYLYLLTEKRFRKILTNFYNAVIGSNENAILLLREDPADIDPTRYSGNQLVRDSMGELCVWLEMIKMFTKSEKIYDEQFLTPFRTASKMIQDYRKMQPRTTEFECWVFSRSKSYLDPHTGTMRATLSMVVPKIQTVMTVRVSDETADEMKGKYAVFENSQPVALVNRIHQQFPKNTTTGRNARLSDFDFLFTGFADIEKLSDSIEMENFCEVESTQSEKRQHLGFPLVSFAKVMDVAGPTIVLQGIRGGDTIHAQISSQYHANSSARPETFRGKTIRFFAVQWYSARSSKDPKFEMPELFFMECEDDVKKLVYEDGLGMIRIRRGMSLAEAEAVLGCAVSEGGRLRIEGGTVSFSYTGSFDRISSTYIAGAAEIRKLRENLKLNAVQVTEDQIIDRRTMSLEGLEFLIKRHSILYDIAADYLLQTDGSGWYDVEKTVAKLGQYPADLIKRKISFLGNLGILEKTDSGYVMTKIGFRVVSACMSRDLKSSFSPTNRPVISIIDAEKEDIPPSILLDFLRNGGIVGYAPMKLDGLETEVFWSMGGAAIDHDLAVAEYSKFRNAILGIMRSVSHPLTARGIIERIASGGHLHGKFVTELFLEESGRSGRIRRSGDSWEYTLVARIYDLFLTRPDDTFAVEDILSSIGTGTVLRGDAERILADLEKEKLITRIGGKWTKNVNVGMKTAQIHEGYLRELITDMLKKNGKMDLSRMISLLDGILARHGGYGNGVNRRNIIGKCIDMMKSENRIGVSEGFVFRDGH